MKAITTAAVGFFLFLAQLEVNADFSGYKLYQAKPALEEDRELLTQMDDYYPEDLVDFWSYPYDEKETVEFLVHANLTGEIDEILDAHNVSYRVKFQDFQMIIEEQMRHIKDTQLEFDFRVPGIPDERKDFDLFNYHKLKDIDRYLTVVEKAFPDLVKVATIGTTYEGRSIKIVTVSNAKAVKKSKPAILMDCGIHAREWVSPAFCLYAIDRLVEEERDKLLQSYDFYIIPVANPDGYEYTWNGNRMWRKNRRPSAKLLLRSARQFWPNQPFPGFGGFGGSGTGGSNGLAGYPGSNPGSKCWGTDPNRNFDINHGTAGSSDNPCQDTYHGDRPFSEAESEAMKTATEQIIASHGGAEKVVYVSVHAYSQLWMFPHGHVKSKSPHHYSLNKVANKAVQDLSATHGTKFKVGPIATVIYQAAGSSTDWVHSKMGVKYAYALELRDRGQHGFMLPVAQIQPTVQETWAGIQGMAWEIVKEL